MITRCKLCNARSAELSSDDVCQTCAEANVGKFLVGLEVLREVYSVELKVKGHNIVATYNGEGSTEQFI